MERTDTSDPYAVLLLPVLDGQSDANAAKGSVGPGTVASRIRSLNELDRKTVGPAIHRIEKNASQEKSVLSRAPPVIREVDRSLQPTPQRPSSFVRRSAERLPTSPTVPSAHPALLVHAPVPKFTIPRPTFLDVSPESNTTGHVAGHWQKPDALHSPTGAERSSYPLSNAAYRPESRGVAIPKAKQPTPRIHGRPGQFEALSSDQSETQGIGKNADNELHMPRTKIGNANPWGITLKKSRPALNTRPPYNSTPRGSLSIKEDITTENKLRTSRPISPSIGIGPRNKLFGSAGERSRPTPKDDPGAASGYEVSSEAPLPVKGFAEKTDRVQAAVQTSEPPLSKTSPQSQASMEGNSGQVAGQQQLDGGKLLTFDMHVKRQADKLDEVIQQLKCCGPWLEEIRTLAQELPSKTTYMESSPDETSDLHHSISTWSSASKSDSLASWEVYDFPSRVRNTSLPDALVAPNDTAETVSSIVKDVLPSAAAEVLRAQSHHDTSQSALSLPDLMEVSIDSGGPALVDPVQAYAGGTPRAHTVDIKPAANINPYWFSSPSAISRYTSTPPPGRTIGKAMSHEALCKILPFPIYPQGPQREERPADLRRKGASFKAYARYYPSFSRKRSFNGCDPSKSVESGSSLSLSNQSSISQYSFQPTPALYFSYQQIPPSVNSTTSDPTLASSYRDPRDVIYTTAQQGHCFPPSSHTDRGTLNSSLRDSPPPPPPGFMSYEPTMASAATKNSASQKQRAQSEVGVPHSLDMSSTETHPLRCESGAAMETTKCQGPLDHENIPIVETLYPVQETRQKSVSPVGNYTSRMSTSQSADPAGLKQTSPALAPPQASSQSTTGPEAPENPVSVPTEDDICPRSAAESAYPLNQPSGEQHLNNSDPATVIHVDKNAEGSKQDPGAASKPASPSPPSASSKSSPEVADSQPPSEAKAKMAPNSSTDHMSSRRPLPLPVQKLEQEQQKRQHEALRRSSEEKRQQTQKRVEQWCRSLPGLRFTSSTGQITIFEDPSGPSPSSTTADSSLPPTQAQHLDVRTRVRLLEAARRVKEMQLKEVRAAATAAAAVEAGIMDFNADEFAGHAEHVAFVDANEEAADALFKGGIREQIGSLDKPFW